MGVTAVIVGCGKEKRNRKCEAQRMYTSTYFAKKREYAQWVGDEWYILSAKYGIIAPNRVISPYEMTAPEDWEVETQWIPADEIIVLATGNYADAISDRRASFPLVEKDFAGMGAQQGWLHEEIQKVKPDV